MIKQVCSRRMTARKSDWGKFVFPTKSPTQLNGLLSSASECMGRPCCRAFSTRIGQTLPRNSAVRGTQRHGDGSILLWEQAACLTNNMAFEAGTRVTVRCRITEFLHFRNMSLLHRRTSCEAELGLVHWISAASAPYKSECRS